MPVHHAQLGRLRARQPDAAHRRQEAGGRVQPEVRYVTSNDCGVVSFYGPDIYLNTYKTVSFRCPTVFLLSVCVSAMFNNLAE